MFAEEKELRGTIESIEAHEGLQRSIEESAETRARQNHNQGDGQLTADQAFDRYIRSAGRVDAETRSLLVPEQRDNVVGTATAGGYRFIRIRINQMRRNKLIETFWQREGGYDDRFYVFELLQASVFYGLSDALAIECAGYGLDSTRFSSQCIVRPSWGPRKRSCKSL